MKIVTLCLPIQILLIIFRRIISLRLLILYFLKKMLGKIHKSLGLPIRCSFFFFSLNKKRNLSRFVALILRNSKRVFFFCWSLWVSALQDFYIKDFLGEGIGVGGLNLKIWKQVVFLWIFLMKVLVAMFRCWLILYEAVFRWFIESLFGKFFGWLLLL